MHDEPLGRAQCGVAGVTASKELLGVLLYACLDAVESRKDVVGTDDALGVFFTELPALKKAYGKSAIRAARSRMPANTEREDWHPYPVDAQGPGKVVRCPG